MPIKRQLRGGEHLCFNNYFLLMSWIEVKALKTLLKDIQRRPAYEKTLEIFEQLYEFRTNLKLPDFQVLLNIAEKINRRHRKNGDTKSTKFGNSQLKLFSWVVVLYCHANELLLPALTHQDYLKIQLIFKNVEIPRIIYEIKCFSYTKSQIETPWTQKQIQLFEQLVRQKKASQWKIIAYEMFKRSECRFFRFFEQYREKWINYLNPQLDKGAWKIEESIVLMKTVAQIGRKWAQISREFNSMRSQHTVKNHHKKLLREVLKIKEETPGKQEENDRRLLAELIRREESQQSHELYLWDKSASKRPKGCKKYSTEGNPLKIQNTESYDKMLKVQASQSDISQSQNFIQHPEVKTEPYLIPYNFYGYSIPVHIGQELIRPVVDEPVVKPSEYPMVAKEEQIDQYEYKIVGTNMH